MPGINRKTAWGNQIIIRTIYKGHKGLEWVFGCETVAQKMHCYTENEYVKWNSPQNMVGRAGCPGFASDKSQEWFL